MRHSGLGPGEFRRIGERQTTLGSIKSPSLAPPPPSLCLLSVGWGGPNGRPPKLSGRTARAPRWEPSRPYRGGKRKGRTTGAVVETRVAGGRASWSEGRLRISEILVSASLTLTLKKLLRNLFEPGYPEVDRWIPLLSSRRDIDL